MVLKYEQTEPHFNTDKDLLTDEAELRSAVFNIPNNTTYCFSISWLMLTQEEAHFGVVLET